MEQIKTLKNGRLIIVMNALAFQVVWFICVQGHSLSGLLVANLLLVAHVIFIRPKANEIGSMVQLVAFGVVFDSLLMSSGAVTYHGHYGNLIPGWLIALWLAFSTTLNHSMKWIFKTGWLPVVTGFFLIPFSYWIGIYISGSKILVQPALFLAAEGSVWALILTWIRYQLKADQGSSCLN